MLTAIINRDELFDYVIFVCSITFIYNYHCLVHSFIAENYKNSGWTCGWGI